MCVAAPSAFSIACSLKGVAMDAVDPRAGHDRGGHDSTPDQDTAMNKDQVKGRYEEAKGKV
jgi:hypothetical protein